MDCWIADAIGDCRYSVRGVSGEIDPGLVVDVIAACGVADAPALAGDVYS